MRIIVLAVLLILIGCKDSALKESNKKPLNDVAFKKISKESNTKNIQSKDLKTKNQDSTDIWKGKYYFEAKNKDDLKTSFEISIKQLGDISLKYISDGNKPETYNHIVGELINPEKLKINFNMNYDEMGIIFLEKDEDEFSISGEPIYFINPGNDNVSIKKIE
ncbi:hypothetical protein [Flavobacterium sp. CF136]|uniref:hypothetical protein n=1 Tax=Flavobacterium sp. (strain CF136) TaxID=1144313 RepID=UPI0002715B45|nr:hypothetical protein [Flavobacterium sp. CF136]EJL62011.1 hypothetical protein PMI10_03103 [Flavobacterium sp. CF136]